MIRSRANTKAANIQYDNKSHDCIHWQLQRKHKIYSQNTRITAILTLTNQDFPRTSETSKRHLRAAVHRNAAIFKLDDHKNFVMTTKTVQELSC